MFAQHSILQHSETYLAGYVARTKEVITLSSRNQQGMNCTNVALIIFKAKVTIELLDLKDEGRAKWQREGRTRLFQIVDNCLPDCTA
jgi:hypothetical protein